MDETVIPDPGSTATDGPEQRHTAPDARALLRENATLRAENLALRELCFANAKARQQAAQLKSQLAEIHGSRAWAAVQKVRRIAAILGRSPKGRGRSLDSCAPADLVGEGAHDPPLPAGERVPEGRVRGPRLIRSGPLKISAIVPNYNHAPYLEERLRSIFQQTHPPHEIIFLDDASSDESVEVARRLASESPVPFRLVLNETNSGSTFRQWLKGIDLAAGDLVWIAESDDTCRPELLECLVPEFLDPEVTLAYCQSAIIGPDGRQVAADYLSCTEDLAPARWRYPYRVPGREEVELALSQRNTIPNASAVVFRKPANLDDYQDLKRLRLGGDWLFYAMRIRRGKIAYIPESLNRHRHHDRTVRNAFEHAVELFEEQLDVKARIFESFPVSAGAISCSMARSFVEYNDRTRGLGPRPAMTEHPRLASRLGRIRSAFRDREWAPRDVRILLVVSGVGGGPGSAEMIGLANELAGRFQVFLCNALPGVLDPVAAARIDERIVLLEGTPGILPWTWDGDPRLDPTAGEAMSSRRAEVVRELIKFHQIDVIHSRGWWADRLVLGAIPEPHTPWFIDLRDGEAYLAESRGDPGWPRLAGEIGSSVRGVFYRRADDLRAFPVPPSPAMPAGHPRPDRGRPARTFPLARTCPVPSGGVGDAAASDRAASAIAEAYRSAVRASRTPGPGPHVSGSAGCLRLQGVPRNAPTRSGGAV